MSLCVIFNPAAKGDKARRFRERLGRVAGDVVFQPTTGPGAARGLARAAVEDGFTVVAAVGGDGTANEVLNGIADAPDGLKRAALGLVPLGTANVFARELGIPFSLPRCWEVLQSGRTREVDLVRATYQVAGASVERWLLQLAGAGLDARAVELVDWEAKKRMGFLAYVSAGLKALREAHPRIRAVAPGTEAVGELVLLGNGRLYGGPFTMFPGADLADGRLDVRVFPRAGWGTALTCVIGLLTGRLGRVGGTIDFRATELRLEADGRVPLEIDGEPVGELPARFEVVPRALRVVVG